MTPQQTPYPNTASYVAAVKAANEAAAAARYYGYSPVDPTDAIIVGGRVGPAGLPYDKSGTKKDVNVSPNNVSPNDAAISAPPEELLGPFSGVVSAIESSVESSILGKVTSLPASEASRFKSDIQSKESSILGIASLSSVSASTTGSPKPRASEKVDEKVAETAEGAEGAEGAEKKEIKEKKGEEAGKEEDKKSGAGALLWESGSSAALVLFSFGIWLA